MKTLMTIAMALILMLFTGCKKDVAEPEATADEAAVEEVIEVAAPSEAEVEAAVEEAVEALAPAEATVEAPVEAPVTVPAE